MDITRREEVFLAESDAEREVSGVESVMPCIAGSGSFEAVGAGSTAASLVASIES